MDQARAVGHRGTVRTPRNRRLDKQRTQINIRVAGIADPEFASRGASQRALCLAQVIAEEHRQGGAQGGRSWC